MIVHHQRNVAGFAGNFITYGSAQTLLISQISITSQAVALVLFPPHIVDGASRCWRVDAPDRRLRIDGATRTWKVDG